MMKLLSPFLIVVLFLKYGDLCMLKSPNWLLTNGTNSSFNRLHSSFNPNVTRSFSIDYESDTFLKDSAPFQFISATFNLYNVPHELWKDRLNKFFAVGLNTIQIHVLWDQHEPYPGVYDFEDEKNISRLLTLAQEFGFNVILRTGGLSDNVGLPWWLSDSDFKVNKTKEWFNVLLPRIVPFLYKNGGPIIAVQLEIDYDAYFTCDFNNTSLFKSIFKKNLGDDVIYFAKVESAFIKSNSSDPMCNQTKDVYPVSAGTVREALQFQRSYSSHGPLVNSEFKIGSSDSWSRPHFKYDIIRIVEQFVETQGMRANINFEGFYGGTNFGTRNNAQKTTSNDQDGAISESGDITHKYLVIRAAISRFFEIPDVPTPSNPLKQSLGKVDMKYFVPLVDVILGTSSKCVKSDALPTFESLGQRYGIILYTTDLNQYDLSNTSISISGIKGRAYVQIGHKSFGTVVSRENKNISVEIPKGKDQSQILYIVVENLDNHGLFNKTNLTAIRSDIKSEASVSINGEALKNWNSCITDNFIPNFRKKLSDQKSVNLVSKYAVSDNLLSQKNLSTIDFSIPGVYIGEFNGSDVDYDTFLRMDNFERGFALIQSNETVTNLGQYWPHVGPQVTLYTPSVFLAKSSKNHVILFELEKSIGCQSSLNCSVEFINHPIIDSI